jgi:hypothetical protein
MKGHHRRRRPLQRSEPIAPSAAIGGCNSSERMVLRALARDGIPAAESIQSPVPGKRLADRAVFHRLLPQAVSLCEELEAARPGCVRDMGYLVSRRDEAISLTQRLLARSAPVVATLADAMPVLLAKGAHVASCAYRADEARTMGDLDVFVQPSSVDRALDICEEHGLFPELDVRRRAFYRAHRGQLALVDENRTMNIDLHWWLNNSPLHQYASKFSLECVWEKARPGRWCGVDVLFPANEDALLLNAMYMGYENWFQRLRMFVDHKRLMALADPDAVLERARAVGLVRVLYASLWLTYEITGTRSPLLEKPACEIASVSRIRKIAERSVRGPGSLTRLARWSIRRRMRLGRFFVRVAECARIYDVTDATYRPGLRRRIVRADRSLIRRLYLTERAATVYALHVVALLVGIFCPGGPLASKERRLFPR